MNVGVRPDARGGPDPDDHGPRRPAYDRGMPHVATVRQVLGGLPPPESGEPGDPGLFGPGSMVWRVTGETVTILGGGRALLMQIAHPLVAAGVADHSLFEEDAFARLWRTLGRVLTVSFGDRDRAIAAARRVSEIHRGVVGERDGLPYRAMDPELLRWVHATLVDTGLLVYERFVGPLCPEERSRYVGEMVRFAEAFGVPRALAPSDPEALRAYVRDQVATLRISEEARELAEGIVRPALSPSLVPVREALLLVTAGLLPPAFREGFGLPWSPGRRRALDALAWTMRRTVPLLPANIRRWPHARDAVKRVHGRDPRE